MVCRQCNELETIFHVLLYCPDIKLYWKKITGMIYSLFHIDIVVDEKIILTGYDVCDKNLLLPNLMLIFAQYTIYRMYVRSNYTAKATNVYILLAEFKKDLLINLKFLVKKKLIDLSQNQLSDLVKNIYTY